VQQAACPVLHDFDPLGAGEIIDPYPALARARREVPVFYVPEYDVWWVTRYEDVKQVLQDPGTYSSAKFVELPPLPKEIEEGLPFGHPLKATLITLDPPVHTRVRKLAQKAFTPRQAERRAGEVRSLAHALIDEFIADGHADLATSYCIQIPIRAIGPVLGISYEDSARLRQWGMDTQMMVANSLHLTEREMTERGRSTVGLDRYVRNLIAERRANPRDDDDMITNLIFAEGDSGEPLLTDEEIVGVVTVAINGSSDTAATSLGNCIHSLLQEREKWEEVARDQSLVPTVVEEAVRLRGPARTLRRDTTRECVIGGVTLPAGATLAVHVGSGSRDEAEFEDADEFELHRSTPRHHLGFGLGTHFCLGAPYARVWLREALQALVQRIPGLRLAPTAAMEYSPSFSVHQLTGGLLVEWDV